MCIYQILKTIILTILISLPLWGSNRAYRDFHAESYRPIFLYGTIPPANLKVFHETTSSIVLPPTQEQLIVSTMRYFEKNLLSLTSEQIKNVLNEMGLLAEKTSPEVREFYVMLSKAIEKKVEYHGSQRAEKYEYNVLKASLVFAILSAVITSAAYCYYKHWHPLSQKYASIKKEWESQGVTFADKVLVPPQFTPSQLTVLQAAVNTMHTMMLKKREFLEKTISSVLLAGCSWILTAWTLIGGLFPQHQKRYEAWQSIHDIIGERIKE